jgi:PEP-CTERM motif
MKNNLIANGERDMKKLFVLLCLTILTLATRAKADNIQTIGPYSGGDYSDPGPYQPPTVIGTFNILAGDTAITISGGFGTNGVDSSAGANLYLGSILVAQCIEFAACWEDSPSGVPFSDTLTAAQIASLGTGTVDFTVVQTAEFVVQLGTTTLDQVTGTAVTPEPSTFALLGTGLLGCFGAIRRKIKA